MATTERLYIDQVYHMYCTNCRRNKQAALSKLTWCIALANKGTK